MTPLGELVAFDCAERRRMTAGEWSDSLALQYEAFPDAQHTLLEQLGAGASMAEAIDAFLAGTELDCAAHERARQALRAVIEAEGADACDEQSLRWMWSELEYLRVAGRYTRSDQSVHGRQRQAPDGSANMPRSHKAT